MLLCCVGFSRVVGVSLSYVCLLCVFYHGTDFELLLNFLSNTYNLAKSGLKQPALKVRNTIVGVFKLVSVYTCWESLSATFYVGLGGFLFFWRLQCTFSLLDHKKNKINNFWRKSQFRFWISSLEIAAKQNHEINQVQGFESARHRCLNFIRYLKSWEACIGCGEAKFQLWLHKAAFHSSLREEDACFPFSPSAFAQCHSPGPFSPVLNDLVHLSGSSPELSSQLRWPSHAGGSHELCSKWPSFTLLWLHLCLLFL